MEKWEPTVKGFGYPDKVVDKFIYNMWESMMWRCLDERQLETLRGKSYRGCKICEEWAYLSNFEEFVLSFDDWRSKQLDKDIKIKGNLTYSKDTCLLVYPEVNQFIVGCNQKSVATYNRNKNRFLARVNNPLTKRREFLGYFLTEIEADRVWRRRKCEIANDLCVYKNCMEILPYLLDNIGGTTCG